MLFEGRLNPKYTVMPAWQRTDGCKQIVQYLQDEGGQRLFIWELFSNAMASIVNPFLYVTNIEFFLLYILSERYPEESDDSQSMEF